MTYGFRSYTSITFLTVATIFSVIIIAFCSFLIIFAIPITVTDVKYDRRHIPELSFYIGALASAPFWLAGIWISAIAFAVQARPFFKWIGVAFLALAVIIFYVLFNVVPEFGVGEN